jgi:hypothetical protein
MSVSIAALKAAVALCSLVTFIAAAHAQNDQVNRGRERAIVRVPVVKPTYYWYYNIAPRYRYRPEDDRVDPCGGPVVPVIRYGPQEATVPVQLADAWGLGRVHGRDWPCRGRNR